MTLDGAALRERIRAEVVGPWMKSYFGSPRDDGKLEGVIAAFAIALRDAPETHEACRAAQSVILEASTAWLEESLRAEERGRAEQQEADAKFVESMWGGVYREIPAAIRAQGDQ